MGKSAGDCMKEIFQETMQSLSSSSGNPPSCKYDNGSSHDDNEAPSDSGGGSGSSGSGSVERNEEYERKQRERRIQLRRKKIKSGTAFVTLLLLCLRFWNKRRRRNVTSTNKRKAIGTDSSGNGNGNGKRINSSKHKSDDYRSATEAPISILLAAAKQGIVKRALMNSSTIAYQLQMKDYDSSWKRSKLPNQNLANEIVNTLSNNGCLDISTLPEPLLARLVPILLTASPFIYLILLYHMMKKLQRGDTEGDLEHMTTDDLARQNDNERITFADVAGMDNRVELEEVVSYLSNPEPFVGVGATPPRGLLLHGPPGCGKTLLAKAVANEARADYFVSCSGSDFVEVYVGQGAKRVRALFSNARTEAFKRWERRHNVHRGGYGDRYGYGYGFGGVTKLMNAANHMLGLTLTGSSRMDFPMDDSSLRPPTAVVFIDEIDALAKCRDGIGRGMAFGGSGGNDEREQTLNALLTEMDGFSGGSVSVGRGRGRGYGHGNGNGMTQKVCVIVIAATNRLAIIDPAILRPGRFDRHIRVSPPDAEGREAILQVHSRKVKLDGKVSLGDFAGDETESFTGADLRNVINEGALLAVRERSCTVKKHHLSLAIKRIRVMKGMS